MTFYSVIATETDFDVKYGVVISHSSRNWPSVKTGTLLDIADKIYEIAKKEKDGDIRIESPSRDLVAIVRKNSKEITRQLTSDEMRDLTLRIHSYMINSK